MKWTVIAMVCCTAFARADEPLAPTEALERTISGLAARVAPSVLRIEVSRVADATPPAAQPAAQGNPFQRFMQELMQNARGTHAAYFKRPAGEVVGFCVGDGLVLTSWYNVAGHVDGLRVTAADGRRRPATILGSDQARDVALLRVEDAAGIPPLALAPEVEPRIGSFAVVCCGGATWGIVSALGRERGTAFQLDARINYGNSGAPVVDLHGRVLGVAGHVYHWSHSGQNSGVGYATSSRYLATIMNDLAAGKVIRGPRQALLGVSGKDAEDAGVVIELVTAGGAAAKAGIAVGDKLVKLGDVEIGGLLQLIQQVSRRQPGEEILVEVVRAGKRVALKATLGERKEGE